MVYSYSIEPDDARILTHACLRDNMMPLCEV